MQFLGKHRVRASFYHTGAGLFVVCTGLQLTGFVSEGFAFAFTAILFVVDYFAQMFDPHPDNMGPWYKRYFHRIIEDDTE